MAIPYGINFTANDIKGVLEQNDIQQNGIRTWRQLFGGAGLGYAAKQDTLTSNYTDVIAQAYKSNLAAQDAIMGAGLSTGAAKNAIAMSRQELQNTYNIYRQNFATASAENANAYNTEVSAIEGALTDRANNFATLYRSAYDYLSQELANATSAKDATTYLSNNLANTSLSWLLNDEGNLYDWNTVSAQLVDANGVLTDRGRQFFDAVFNATPGGYNTISVDGKDVAATRSFDQWLSDTNPDLRTWYAGQDSFNYNLAGTNAGTANVLTGRESTDTKYGQYEYFYADELLPKLTVSTDVNAAASGAKAAYDKWVEDGERIKEREKRNAAGASGSSATDTREGWGGSGPKAREAWVSYLDTFNANSSGAVYTLYTALGREGLTEFNTQYKTLLDEYTKLFKEAQSSKYYDEKQIKKLNDWRDRLSKAVKEFGEKRMAQSKKTSGF